MLIFWISQRLLDALRDVGGAMAGTNNAQVAQELVSMLKEVDRPTHRGVVYFNGRSESWHVLEIDNQRDIELRSSSLQDSDCFVFFDESHCRGVDKKLKRESRALVTLEPKMTKDKFLQVRCKLTFRFIDGVDQIF